MTRDNRPQVRETLGSPAVHGPCCPFCGAAWSDAMLERYDAASDPGGCTCCGRAGHGVPGRVESRDDRAPAEDLCCDTCGRAIFFTPSSAGA
jgi:hypothetical protein